MAGAEADLQAPAASPGRLEGAMLLAGFGGPAGAAPAAAMAPAVAPPTRGLQPLQFGGGVMRGRVLFEGGTTTTGVAATAAPVEPPATDFLHARNTPRSASDLMKPPLPGTTWKYMPQSVNADGADAGPKAIAAVCQESDAAYKQERSHCSVHVKRNVVQKQYDVFNGDAEAQRSSAKVVTGMLEMLKEHSITISLATEGKKLLKAHLESAGERSAAAYLEQEHLCHKITNAEINPPRDAGMIIGGVPCHSNSIERANLNQKEVGGPAEARYLSPPCAT